MLASNKVDISLRMMGINVDMFMKSVKFLCFENKYQNFETTLKREVRDREDSRYSNSDKISAFKYESSSSAI